MQWIPSHVGIYLFNLITGIKGNEIADSLAKEGCKEDIPLQTKLTYKEIYSRDKERTTKTWKVPPKHHWYNVQQPGRSFQFPYRQDQTAISRLSSGHLRPVKMEKGEKSFPTCSNRKSNQATPEHILSCINCTRLELRENS